MASQSVNDGYASSEDDDLKDYYRRVPAPFKHLYGRKPAEIWDHFNRFKYILVDGKNGKDKKNVKNKMKGECVYCRRVCSGTAEVMINHLRYCRMVSAVTKDWAVKEWQLRKKREAAPESKVCFIYISYR